MDRVPLGSTGLLVSRLGVGLAEIGHQLSVKDVKQAGLVLNRAIDAGINLLDTAACYGVSEELVGAAMSKRRSEYVLATKAGHVVGDYRGQAWEHATVADSINRSLQRMRTDHVDIVQLHSCGIDVLEKGDAVRALQDAKAAGKTRFIGYSGDNEAGHWAVDSGLFDTLQTSFSLVDQQARTSGLLEKADQKGMGIIIKRPIANGAWGARSSPSGYAGEYHRRAVRMLAEGKVESAPDDRILLALGFTFAHPQVDVAIVGTHNPDHMGANIGMVERDLPIDPRAVEELHRRFERLDSEWRQMT